MLTGHLISPIEKAVTDHPSVSSDLTRRLAFCDIVIRLPYLVNQELLDRNRKSCEKRVLLNLAGYSSFKVVECFFGSDIVLFVLRAGLNGLGYRVLAAHFRTSIA